MQPLGVNGNTIPGAQGLPSSAQNIVHTRSRVRRWHTVAAAVALMCLSIGVAEANLRVAQVAVEQTLIVAPFTGVVLTKNANVGDILTPFSAASGTTGASAAVQNVSSAHAEKPEAVQHHVKKGETLYSIARAYGTTISALRNSNPFLADRPLAAGDVLVVQR